MDGQVSIYQGTQLILHCALIEGRESMGSADGWSYVQLAGFYAKMVEDGYREHFVRSSSVPVLGLEVVGNVFRSALALLTRRSPRYMRPLSLWPPTSTCNASPSHASSAPLVPS